MTIRVQQAFKLPCAVTLDENGRVTNAYVIPERAALMAMIEELMPLEERQAIAHEATRNKLSEGLVRVHQGINTVSYWRLVRLTQTQALLRRPETKHEVRFNLKWGRQVGEYGYSTPRIHDEELVELRARAEQGMR